MLLIKIIKVSLLFEIHDIYSCQVLRGSNTLRDKYGVLAVLPRSSFVQQVAQRGKVVGFLLAPS